MRLRGGTASCFCVKMIACVRALMHFGLGKQEKNLERKYSFYNYTLQQLQALLGIRTRSETRHSSLKHAVNMQLRNLVFPKKFPEAICFKMILHDMRISRLRINN
jgi:hypothetical protein